MTTLATQLEAWITEADGMWGHGDGVVGWARALGGTPEQLWKQCPRAHYLVVLAELGCVAHPALQRALCAVTKRLVDTCPELKKVGAMQRVLEGAASSIAIPESFTVDRGAALRAFKGKTSAAHKAYVAGREGVERFVLEARGRGHRTSAEVPLTLVNAPELAPIRAYLDHTTRREAAQLTIEAFAESLSVARVADGILATTAELAVAEEDPNRTDEAVDLVLSIRDAGTSIVASSADLLFMAARAEAYVCARSPAAWEACVRAALVAPPAGTTDESILRTFSDAHAAWIERRALAFIAEYTDILRAEIAFESLDFGADRGVTSAPITSMGEARASISNGLLKTLQVVEAIGHDQARDPIEVALAILSAPGELDRAALGPVMATIHETLAALFRAEAKAAGPREGKPWLGLADQVDEDRRFFVDWMSQHTAPARN